MKDDEDDDEEQNEEDDLSDLPLFARSGDPDTSHQSMEQYDRDRIKNATAFVISLYLRFGEMADFQLKQKFDELWPEKCSAHLYRQARSVARDFGKIIDTGRRLVNPESNRLQVVWAFNDGEPIMINKCPWCGHILRRGGNAGRETVGANLRD